LAGLQFISANPRPPANSAIAEASDLLQPDIPPLVMTPREAALARKRVVPLSEAVGSSSAESIMFYPPGIPLLMPGEEVTADILSVCRALLAGGAHCYASDPTLATMRIVADDKSQ